MEKRYDVVIVGGGPAGLTAGLALGRARRSVLVIDSGAPRNAPAAGVHNYLTRDGVAPADLRAAGRAEVVGYGGEILDGNALSASRTDDGFRVAVEGREAVGARRLLVTTGLTDVLPPVAGMAERWGRDVLHCPYCHGWEVRDEPVGVVAIGPMGVHHALLWRNWTDDVVLFTNGVCALDAEARERLEARGVRVVDGQVVAVEVGDDALSGVRLASGEVVARKALAVQTVLETRGGVLASLGLLPVDHEVFGTVIGTRIPAAPSGATDVPGVFVAGNVADPMAQVVTSAAAGLTAAAAINAELIEEDTRDAVAVLRRERAVHAG